MASRHDGVMSDHDTAQGALDIRVALATDDERYRATDDIVWFGEENTEPVAAALEGLPPDQRFAAEVEGADPSTYAGVYGVRPLVLSAPGSRGDVRQVPVAGLTYVGVHPDHRRQGVLRAMMRHHLEQTRAEGVVVSALHASETEIYGRYGYGLAGLEFQLKLGRGTTLTAPHLDAEAARITTRMATITDAGMADRIRACDLRVGARETGTLVFLEGVYRRWTHLEPSELRDREAWRALFAQLDGVDVGYVLFRRKHKWEDARPGGELETEMLTGSPAARLALVRRLVDFDLMATVTLKTIGADDALWHWLPGPRGVSDAHPYDNIWIRLVDLPAALAARGYEGSCDVVVDVTDDLLPDNEGAWRLSVAGGEARATRTTDPVEVRLGVAHLGSAWLGWGNLAAMHRAGVVAEERPGAVSELWRAMRLDVAPWPSPGF